MTHVLVFNGAPGCGKTTLQEMIKEQSNSTVQTYSSIDWVKDIARYNMGWDGVKDDKSRIFLAKLKNLATWYNDMPLKKTVENIKACTASFLFVDIREAEEIQKLVNVCNGMQIHITTILVRRKEAEEYAKKNLQDSFGDNDWMNFEYNIVVHNNDTLGDLWYNTTIVLKNIGG